MGDPPTHARLLDRALSGDKAALRELVDVLRPEVQLEVGRVLIRRAGEGRGRRVRQEVEDFTQEVFVGLFRDRARALRLWRPEGGRSLIYFVRWFANHAVRMQLRSARRSPWSDQPTEAGELARMRSHPPFEGAVASRELLGRLLEQLEAALSPRNMYLFQLLYVEQETVPEICKALGMSRDAVYTARRRLQLKARAIAERLLGADQEKPSPGVRSSSPAA